MYLKVQNHTYRKQCHLEQTSFCLNLQTKPRVTQNFIVNRALENAKFDALKFSYSGFGFQNSLEQNLVQTKQKTVASTLFINRLSFRSLINSNEKIKIEGCFSETAFVGFFESIFKEKPNTQNPKPQTVQKKRRISQTSIQSKSESFLADNFFPFDKFERLNEKPVELLSFQTYFQSRFELIKRFLLNSSSFFVFESLFKKTRSFLEFSRICEKTAQKKFHARFFSFYFFEIQKQCYRAKFHSIFRTKKSCFENLFFESILFIKFYIQKFLKLFFVFIEFSRSFFDSQIRDLHIKAHVSSFGFQTYKSRYVLFFFKTLFLRFFFNQLNKTLSFIKTSLNLNAFVYRKFVRCFTNEQNPGLKNLSDSFSRNVQKTDLEARFPFFKEILFFVAPQMQKFSDLSWAFSFASIQKNSSSLNHKFLKIEKGGFLSFYDAPDFHSYSFPFDKKSMSRTNFDVSSETFFEKFHAQSTSLLYCCPKKVTKNFFYRCWIFYRFFNSYFISLGNSFLFFLGENAFQRNFSNFKLRASNVFWFRKTKVEESKPSIFEESSFRLENSFIKTKLVCNRFWFFHLHFLRNTRSFLNFNFVFQKMFQVWFTMNFSNCFFEMFNSNHVSSFQSLQPNEQRILSLLNKDFAPEKIEFVVSDVFSTQQNKMRIGKNFFYSIQTSYQKLLFKTFLFKPRIEFQSHLADIKSSIKLFASQKQETLIQKLTEKILIWLYVNKKNLTFYSIAFFDRKIRFFLWNWACRRHNNKNKKWIQRKYFQKFQNRLWIFGEQKTINVKIKSSNFPDSNLRFSQNARNSKMLVYLPTSHQIFLTL